MAQTPRLEVGDKADGDPIAIGERVAIVDDVLATGGTAAAAANLVERLGGNVVSMAFLIVVRICASRAGAGLAAVGGNAGCAVAGATGLVSCAGSAAGVPANGNEASLSSWAATEAASCLTRPPSSLISPSAD